MKATFTYLDELNDFLPPYRKNSSFSLEFAASPEPQAPDRIDRCAPH